MKGIWSQEDNDWLMANYREGVDYCAKYLGRSYKSVSMRLYVARVSSTGRPLKELVPWIKPYVKAEKTYSKLPPFHPVILGIYPIADRRSSYMWRKRRAIILKMHDNCCAYCGDEANTVDHVIPINKGGTDYPENLVAACLRCNSAFGDRTKHIEMRIA